MTHAAGALAILARFTGLYGGVGLVVAVVLTAALILGAFWFMKSHDHRARNK
ncbi:MAG: hypothetical protein IRZ18_09240 [Clostridia bacterium]|nr:hypothetical protein [Clostridia bacterium]